MTALPLLLLLTCGACALPAPPAIPPAPLVQQHEHPVATRVIPDDLTPREAVAVNLYRRAVPSVVRIQARKHGLRTSGPPRPGDFGSGAAPDPGGALGSGVLISAENHILTAAHVVDGADEIRVRTHDGRDRRARRLFSEPAADIALLQLETIDATLPYSPLGDSDRLAVGQDVFVIGNPRGLANTFTRGTLSGFREFGRLYDGTILVDFLQTDAAINSGNSGGPVFDSRGRIVGIASRISTRSGGSEGLGFAVTINSAKRLLALEDRSWTGLQGVYVGPDELSSLFQLDLPGALLVQDVEAGSPAAKAGLRGGVVDVEIAGRPLLLGGDLIVQIGQQAACHSACLSKAHDAIRKEDAVKVIFLRGGKRHETVLDLRDARRSYLEAATAERAELR